jgi:hypothetical protein
MMLASERLVAGDSSGPRSAIFCAASASERPVREPGAAGEGRVGLVSVVSLTPPRLPPPAAAAA